jgi:hypothetical protein
MKRLVALAVVLAALPSAAQAHSRPVVPQGNSGADQYVEIIPTAGGGRPSHTVHTGGRRSGGPGALSAGTQQAMSSQGSLGAQAARFAQATAPPNVAVSHAKATSRRRGSAHPSSRRAQAAPATTVPAVPASASSTVIDSLTGGSGGGVGVALPIVLAATLAGVVLIRLYRLRRHSS